MNQDQPADAYLREILIRTRTVALVGASDNPLRPSNEVMHFLVRHGYRVFAVNPALSGSNIDGVPLYHSLQEIPENIDMVDIFRNSQAAADVVDAALTLPVLPKTIWMQIGVINEPAAARARARGLAVIMDKCPKIEIRRLSIAARIVN